MSEARGGTGSDVARQRIMEELARVRRQGTGGAVFLLGPRGSGKSKLLRRVRRHARFRSFALRTALSDCGALAAGASAWQKLGGAGTVHLRLGHVARRTTADWLNLLPGIGDLASAVAGTVEAIRQDDRKHAGGHGAMSVGTAAALGVRHLYEHGARHPRLLIIDSLERADPADLAATALFLRRIRETRTLLLLASDTPPVGADDRVRDLLLEAERSGTAFRLVLAPASPATPATQPAHPPASSPLPADLPADDVVLLERAAAIGATFTAAALAQASSRPELEIEDRLARLTRLHLIRYVGTEGEEENETSVYTFITI